MTISKNTFTGEYSYSIDAKGRINIPAKFRQSLSKNNDNTFVVTRGLDTCIWVYPIIIWQKIETELKNLSALSSINRSFIRNAVRYAAITPYDKQGRILLTPSLIRYAELEKEAIIIGMVNKIEIWNPKTLNETDKQNLKLDPSTFEDLAEKIIL